MAANPNQTLEDLTPAPPYVPPSAETEHRLTQLQSRAGLISLIAQSFSA